jgi:two-component system response regulator BaeR
VELDCEAQRVRAGGREVDLTATEFALLERLARQSGRVFTRAELATLVDLDLESSERTIDSHVKNIRKKLREAERAQRAERELVAGVAHDLAMWLVFKVAVRPGNRVRAP